jgi:hypothetical protein
MRPRHQLSSVLPPASGSAPGPVGQVGGGETLKSRTEGDVPEETAAQVEGLLLERAVEGRLGSAPSPLPKARSSLAWDVRT